MTILAERHSIVDCLEYCAKSFDLLPELFAMASGDASQLTDVPERRLGRNGRPYTLEEFLQYFVDAGEREWANAEREVGTGGTVTALAITRDATQLPAGSAPARLMPEQVIAIQQEEAARGPPRSLHRLARDALNEINNRPTRDTVDLDGCFPWVQYVAAHRLSAQIIGPGITHAHAVFFPDTNDANRGGAPRLDFCFYRTDGSICRVHPGSKPKRDADLLFRQ